MPSSDREIRIKRLYFRSNHRGSKETDIILGHYAQEQLAHLSDDELVIYEAFLDESDNDIWDWVTERSNSPDPRYQHLITHLRQRYVLSK